MKIATRALSGLFAAALMVTAGAAYGPGQTPPPANASQPAPKPGERQDRRWKWWMDGEVQKALGMSTAQASKIDRIWESSVPSIRAAHGEMEGLEAELSRLIRENTADEAVVALQIDRVEAQRSQINKARSLMLYRMHRVLTTGQYQALTKLMDKWRKERRDEKPRGR